MYIYIYVYICIYIYVYMFLEVCYAVTRKDRVIGVERLPSNLNMGDPWGLAAIELFHRLRYQQRQSNLPQRFRSCWTCWQLLTH